MREQNKLRRKVEISDINESDVKVDFKNNELILFNDIREMPHIGEIQFGMNFIIICRDGRLELRLNNKNIELVPGDLLIMQSNASVRNVMMSPDFACGIMCISDNLLKSQLRNHINIWNRALYVNNMNIFKLKVDMKQARSDIFHNLLLGYIKAPRKYFSDEVVSSLVRCMLLDLCALIKEQIPEESVEGPSQPAQLFNHFLQILNDSEVKRHSVEYYAKQLCITPKYLSFVCKQQTGKPALQWINEYVDEDIRYYLEHSPLSIKEISNQLGFPNISFFGKYVRQHFGVSPKAYRKDHFKKSELS